jgi:hypothetical protein
MDDQLLEKVLKAHYREQVAASDPEDAGHLPYSVLREAALERPLPSEPSRHLEACARCGALRRELAAELSRDARLPWWNRLPVHRSRVLRRGILAAAVVTALIGVAAIPRSGPGYLRIIKASGATALTELASGELPDPANQNEEPPRVLRGGPEVGEVSNPRVLSHDEITLDVPEKGRHGPFVIRVDGPSGRIPYSDFAALPLRVPPPKAGWVPGSYTWVLSTQHAELVGIGSWSVLGPQAEAAVHRAEREFAGDAERLAAVYYVLGLRERCNALLKQELPRRAAADRQRLRARFHLKASEP